MSGGIDSTVTAMLLHEAGYQVVGITMKTWDYANSGGTKKETGCCSLDSINDARQVAVDMGFHHFIIDIRDEFGNYVIDNFIEEYMAGRTPNPCVLCNTHIKWNALLRRADALDCEFIATGHYARIIEQDERRFIRRAAALNKDQSYVLGVLTAEQLRQAAFPVGDTPKPEIRAEAARRGFAVSDKPDSHDICFIPSGDTRAFLGDRIGVRPGAVVDADGAVLARHDGVHGFTIGQRKGLGIPGPGPDGQPRYVTAIEADTGTVRVGSAQDLEVWELTGRDPVWTAGVAPAGPLECEVQVRAHGGVAPGVAELRNGRVVMALREPLRGVAAGQTMVLYRPDPVGDEVIGSATIVRSEPTASP